MLREVSAAEMLAVDVEHHHRHSYLGFVCLLQLNAGKTVPLLHALDASTMHDVLQGIATCTNYTVQLKCSLCTVYMPALRLHVQAECSLIVHKLQHTH